jgi:hypothetical protein
MSDIFAMQRANGDWFALDHHGRLRVPLFHSSRDGMIALMRNSDLVVFKPVVVDERFLKEISAMREDEVDFCMVDDPYVSFNRGSIVGRQQLASLIRRPGENIGTNGKTIHVAHLSALPQTDTPG